LSRPNIQLLGGLTAKNAVNANPWQAEIGPAESAQIARQDETRQDKMRQGATT
jgi:hypothetical protein